MRNPIKSARKGLGREVPGGGRLTVGIGVVVATGLALSVGTLVYFFSELGRTPTSLVAGEVALILGIAYAVSYGGYWLYERDLGEKVSLRVASWCLAGLAGTGTIATWVITNQYWKGVAVEDPVVFTLAMLSAGAAAGVLVGIKEVRARQRASVATSRQDDLVVVNELLRHHVLNGVNVVKGDVNALVDQVDDSGQDHIERVRRRSERITSLVQNLQTLTLSLSGRSERYEVDAAGVLRREADRADSMYSDLTVEVDAPASAPVVADEALGAVFEHLFRNVQTQEAAGVARIEVSLYPHNDRYIIDIVDYNLDLRTPPGIDPFEADDDSDIHLGLYLVQSLVGLYGGSLVYEPLEGGGGRLVMDLPAA